MGKSNTLNSTKASDNIREDNRGNSIEQRHQLASSLTPRASLLTGESVKISDSTELSTLIGGSQTIASSNELLSFISAGCDSPNQQQQQPVKILDVQKRAAASEKNLADWHERTRGVEDTGTNDRRLPHTIATNPQQHEFAPGPSSGDKNLDNQQHSETLSSFESDYDLLVYLGETETEDLIDTERSLDYQDQTWRQSICGGASLAPTLDESLSELMILGPANNTNNYASRNSLSQRTLTPVEASPLIVDEDELMKISSNRLGTSANDLFAQTLETTKNQFEIQQADKNFHLIHKNPHNHQEKMVPSSSRQNYHTSNSRTFNDVPDELDRLLAEMNQSLDLDALALYDPQPQKKQRQRHRLNPKPNESVNSLLDEYDGASRILEQMISDGMKARENQSSSKAEQETSGLERKQSTCSSSAASVVPNTRKFTTAPATGIEKTPGANLSDEILVNRSIWRYRSSIKDHDNTPEESQSPDKSVDPRVLRGSPSSKSSRHSDAGNLMRETRKNLRPTAAVLVGRKGNQEVLTRNPLVSNAPNKAQCQAVDKQQHIRVPTSQTTPNSSNTSISSTSLQRPPPLPEIDYHDRDEGNVINVVASQIPSSSSSSLSYVGKDPKPSMNAGSRMVSRVKKRTLSKVRSMRNKFNDLVSPQPAASRESEMRADKTANEKPAPPKRSSSALSSGSQRSKVSADRRELTAKEHTNERQSRQRTRRRDQQETESRSFGQQMRERLSRSRSRFSRFIKENIGERLKGSKRSQSTPDEQRGARLAKLQENNLLLFQPSDISRNTTQSPNNDSSEPRNKLGEASDSSLDRHLQAHLDKRTKSSVSSFSSLNDLSGLETSTKPNRSPRKQTKKSATIGKQRDANFKREHRRSSSLMSIKRLGNTFRVSKDEDLKQFETQDLDLMKIRTKPNLIATTSSDNSQSTALKTNQVVAQPKRRRKRRNKSTGDKYSNVKGSNPSDINLGEPKYATTDDYFGSIGPPRMIPNSDAQVSTLNNLTVCKAPPVPPPPVHLKVEVGPEVKQAKSDRVSPMAALNETAEVNEGLRKLPSRSQSFNNPTNTRRVNQATSQAVHGVNHGNNNTESSPEKHGHRTVSFSDLNRAQTSQSEQRNHRFLSPNTNSFRPSSAGAQLNPSRDSASDQHSKPTTTISSEQLVQPSGKVTPLWPGPLLDGPNDVVLRNNQEIHRQVAKSKSPMRQRGSSLLNDIRSKCTELFATNKPQPLAEREFNHPASKPVTHRLPPLPPPVRPPRRRERNFSSVGDDVPHRRSKSLHCPRIDGVSEFSSGDCQLISPVPAGPSSGILSEIGNKQTNLSNMDEQEAAKENVITQPVYGESLCEWSPIITSSGDVIHSNKLGGTFGARGTSFMDNLRRTSARKESQDGTESSDSSWDSSSDHSRIEEPTKSGPQQLLPETAKTKLENMADFKFNPNLPVPGSVLDSGHDPIEKPDKTDATSEVIPSQNRLSIYENESLEEKQPEPPKIERRLVKMTSIIKEPGDELMNLSANVSIRSAGSPDMVAASSGSRLLDDEVIGCEGFASDDSESSMSAVGGNVAASRRRLEGQFQRQTSSTKAPAPEISGIQRSRASNSIVRRLAQNFDQGLVQNSQQKPSQASTSQRPMRDQVSGPTVVKRQLAPIQLRKSSFEESDPKSDSTWYDAKSAELLDEAEVAELLREYGTEPESTLTSSSSSSTDEEPGRRDEINQGTDGTATDKDKTEEAADDDDTLNDDQGDNSMQGVIDLDDYEDEESHYASAACEPDGIHVDDVVARK